MSGFNVTPVEFQAKFFFSAVRFPAFVAAWGTGKTLWGIARALACATKVPNNLILIVRREFTDLRDSTIKDFERYTNLKLDGNKEVHFDNGSIIMFRHGAELDTLKNINLGAFFIEQAEEFNDDSQFQFLRGRLRRDNVPFHSGWVIANTNGHNWIWKLWKQQKNPEYELFEATTFDNEQNLPKDFISDLHRLEKEAPAIYRRYVLNSWEETEGSIWPQWSEDRHVIAPFTIPKHWERFVSIDPPVASGVMAGLWFAVDEVGTCYIYDEYYAKDLLISDHCENILKITSGDLITRYLSDTSAFNKTREKAGQLYSVADEFRDYSIILQRAEKDVYAGINRVGEYWAKNKLKVCANCVKLREYIPQYRWADLRPNLRGEAKSVPYRVDTHLVEALRYGIMSRPQASTIAELVIPRGSVAWEMEEQAREANDWRSKYR